jgi:hypothetical protein
METLCRWFFCDDFLQNFHLNNPKEIFIHKLPVFVEIFCQFLGKFLFLRKLHHILTHFFIKTLQNFIYKHKPSSPLKLQWHWHNHVRTHWPICVNIQISQLLKGGIDQWGVDHDSSFLQFELHWRQQIFELCKIGEINPHTSSWKWQRQLGRVRISSFMSIMSTHQQEELNMAKGSAYSCSHPTWKPKSHAMAVKTSEIASWVPMGKSMVRWLMFDILKNLHLTLATIPTFKIIIKL